MDEKTLAKIKRENELSIATHEEFTEFCKRNDVFYWYGEEYQIEALISTEEEFIEFMQKVGLKEEWFGGECLVPFFVGDRSAFEAYFTYKDTVAESDHDLVDTFQLGDDEPEIVGITRHPTHVKDVFVVHFNQYFEEKPYRIQEGKVRLYDHNDIAVKPEIIEKFPCVVTFVSHDTFDRMGSIEGSSVNIIPIKRLTNKPLFS